MPGDFELLFRNSPAAEAFPPLLTKAGRQGEVAAGVEKESVRGPLAEEHIRADQGHVGNHRAAEHPRQGRLLQHELPFHAAAHAAVEGPQRIRFCASPPHLANVSCIQRKLSKPPKRT